MFKIVIKNLELSVFNYVLWNHNQTFDDRSKFVDESISVQHNKSLLSFKLI